MMSVFWVDTIALLRTNVATQKVHSDVIDPGILHQFTQQQRLQHQRLQQLRHVAQSHNRHNKLYIFLLRFTDTIHRIPMNHPNIPETMNMIDILHRVTLAL